MILAGIEKNEINPATIRQFLTTGGIESTPEVTKASVHTTEAENIEPEATIVEKSEEANAEPALVETSTNALKLRFSMKNSKDELLEAAASLDIPTKKSMTKAKILELINKN